MPLPFAGKATRNEEDENWDARLKLEKRLIKAILPILTKQQKAAKPKAGETDAAGAIERIKKFTPELRSAARGVMLEVLNLALDSVTKQLPDPVIDSNDLIREWLDSYLFGLVTGINETTSTYLTKRIGRFVAGEIELPDLIADLEPVFGKRRAELIASTEVTRAYAQGRVFGWRLEGLATNDPLEMPPLHPRCRCILTIREVDGERVYIWHTVRDDRVCPICGPKNNQSVGVASVIN